MSLLDVLLLIIALLLLFTALSIVVLTLVWIERKFLGRLQRRLGRHVPAPSVSSSPSPTR